MNFEGPKSWLSSWPTSWLSSRLLTTVSIDELLCTRGLGRSMCDSARGECLARELVCALRASLRWALPHVSGLGVRSWRICTPHLHALVAAPHSQNLCSTISWVSVAHTGQFWSISAQVLCATLTIWDPPLCGFSLCPRCCPMLIWSPPVVLSTSELARWESPGQVAWSSDLSRRAV